MMRTIRRGWLSSIALGATVVAMGCSSVEGMPNAEQFEDRSGEQSIQLGASPKKVVGVWLAQATNTKNPDGTAALPELDMAFTLHDDGTAMYFFFDFNFGSVGFPTTPPILINSIGGSATWEWKGHDIVRLEFFHFYFDPLDQTNNVLNTQIPVGYIRGEFEGRYDGKKIEGKVAYQVISTFDPICPGGKAPCVLAPVIGDNDAVVLGDMTLTSFEPSRGPKLPRYDVGPFPKVNLK